MSKHLELEMNKLRNDLLSLMAVVEDTLKKSLQSFVERNRELAKEVIKSDEIIDAAEVEIEECCLKALALHQPVANDLRYLIGVIKLNNELERIGDLAINIAERALYVMDDLKISTEEFDFTQMSEVVIEMLKKSIDSLIHLDSELAVEVLRMDDEVDLINKKMHNLFFAAVGRNPDHASVLMNFVSVSRKLERIGDCCTNIAEDVIYIVDGTIVRHKPDISSEK